MKKIAIIATEKEYAKYLKETLEKYIGKYAQSNEYSLEEFESLMTIEEEYGIVASSDVMHRVRKKAGVDMEVILISLSLSKMQMKMLEALPKGARALLVNIDYSHCMRLMELLYNGGFSDVELFPYFGIGEYDRDIKFAITPNELQLIPESIETVINLGESVINMDVLYLIAEKIGVYNEFVENEAYEIRKEFFSNMDKLLDERKTLRESIKIFIQFLEEGIILIDENERIYLCNKTASEMMLPRTKRLDGSYVYDIFPELKNKKDIQFIKLEQERLCISTFELKQGEEILGNIIFLSRWEEPLKQKINSELSDAPHGARFTFEEIIGESQIIKEKIAYAKGIAKNNYPVLITGESGTGKEVFAQSIHNESERCGFNFVAINCAAIPENLLESELFGYARGAFTGANKEGKVGLFELAHKGTLFLDEIGEMPLLLQAKLLRVLEEHRIMPVGANKTISVDVRIIAATNKNLYDMVKRKLFREDLYYRINVLPLELQSLKERPEDILPLFYYYARNANKKIVLTKEAEKKILSHTWHGNVRELRNMVEYLTCYNKRIIDVDAFPPSWEEDTVIEEDAEGYEETMSDSLMEKFILLEGRNISLHRLVLNVLKESCEKGEKLGRVRMLERIGEDNPHITEGDIRYSLKVLSEYGFAIAGRGRSGTVISKEGKAILKHLEYDKIGFIRK
ncbi:sigma 54-interacting transcriptional regulator [Emergencia sp. JLR.KK010]|jgi:transcriptional regulator with PAS, ATPase and Fis domain|uniref:sigma-54 interaction domain-containing protein n=1 Tax=Emergencia sp. JLR.KK010 TaxID=3114296 RepID=UPI0030CE925F